MLCYCLLPVLTIVMPCSFHVIEVEELLNAKMDSIVLAIKHPVVLYTSTLVIDDIIISIRKTW